VSEAVDLTSRAAASRQEPEEGEERALTDELYIYRLILGNGFLYPNRLALGSKDQTLRR
jgi:hypothetical protein